MADSVSYFDKWRPLPFWSWNDELEPEILRSQVREMHRAGLGGFFMHARGGLTTAYLSDRWMECVSAVLDEASKCGMQAYLYDENGWPSGFGNGIVNGMGEKYQQKYLHFESGTRDDCGRENTIAWYDAEGSLLGKTLPAEYSGKVMRCFYELNPYYVDNLDPDTVAEFLRCTHQYYVDNLPPELLPHLKGIFTDEPQLSREGYSWSPRLPDEYRRRFDRDLLTDLPALFLELPSSSQIRVNFWSMITELFRESYISQISKWCKKHDWILTGHHLAEEKPLDQILANGSLMAQYSAYDIPGTDHLCRIKPDLTVMIQLVSAALQSGKEQILTESFGLAGWNLNFHGMCWLYHQQLACGINLLCQHLSSYSLKGLRKRDYPGSYFIHQPWWDDYSKLNDHFAFAGTLIGKGQAQTNLAVLHPLSTGWSNYSGDLRSSTLEYYNARLTELTNALMANFHEFHFIDETVFAESGGVENTKLTVGKCAYSTVIIPPLTNLSGKIIDALKVFAGNGGRTVVLTNTLEPEKLTVDGLPADGDTRRFFADLPRTDSIFGLLETLEKLFPEHIKIEENGQYSKSFTGICRKIDTSLIRRSGKFYLIASSDYQLAHQVTLRLPATGCAVELISPDGSTFSPIAEAEKRDGYWTFPYSFTAGEGAMFFVPDTVVSADAPCSVSDPFQRPAVKAAGNNFQLTGKSNGNLLLLDRCRYRVDNGEWISTDVSTIHGRMLKLRKDALLDMEFEFEIDEKFDLTTQLELIVETPERFSFKLNGQDFSARKNGTLFDQAFHRITLPQNLKSGKNTLFISTLFHETAETYATLKRAEKFETEYNRLTFESEIENIFLHGDFALMHHGEVENLERDARRFNGKFILTAPPGNNVVDEKNLTADGFSFFAGKITIGKEFELSANEAKEISILRFHPHGVNSCRIVINGQDAGFLYSGKFAVPVHGLLQKGKNTISVEMTLSLRNMLGPHHLAEGESYRVTTLSFSKEANAVGWQPPEFADGYCMVNNGITDMEWA